MYESAIARNSKTENVCFEKGKGFQKEMDSF